MSEPEKRTRSWLQVVLIILSLVGGGVVLWLWGPTFWAVIRDRERLQGWVDQLGPWGPVATIALNVGQVILAPVPGQFVGVINGYLYGLAAGTLYSMIGLLIGTAIAMVLARRFGRPLVEQLVPEPQVSRWDELTANQGPVFFFLVFLLPFVPDDVTSFLVGLSPLSIPRMLVLATLGRLPGVFVSSWVGARAAALPWWAWFPLGGGAAGLAWLFWRYQSELENLVVHLIQRLTKD